MCTGTQTNNQMSIFPQKKAGKGKKFKRRGWVGRRLCKMFHHSVGRKQVRASLPLPTLLPLANSLKSHCIVLTGQCLLDSGPHGMWRLFPVESAVSGLESLPIPGYLYEPGHGNTFQEIVLELPGSTWNKTNGPCLTSSTKTQCWVKTFF